MADGVKQVARGWTAFFWAAAAFNIAISLAGLAGKSGTPIELVVSVLVLGFGIVYVLVARDPLRFAPVLWAGIVGKLGVVALLAPQVGAPGEDPLLGPVLVGDTLFALGFALFLWIHRKG